MKILALIVIILSGLAVFTGETSLFYISFGITLFDSVLYLLSKERK